MTSSDHANSLFDGLVGNEDARELLLSDFQRHRVAGAYLLHGPEGIGKRQVALRWAAAINCDKSTPESPLACGHCASCKRIAGGNHPLMHFLSPLETANIKTDQVEQVLELLGFKATGQGHQFVFIDPAEAMTPKSANSLLKTIEEPPPDTTIVLISAHLNRVLPTIRSRCRIVAFHPIPAARLAMLLADRFEIQGSAAELLAGLSGGSFALADPETAQQAIAMRQEALQVMEWTGQRKLHEAFEAAGKWMKQPQAILLVLLNLESMIRDCVVLRTGAARPLMHADRKEALAAYAGLFSAEFLADLAARISQTRVWLFERNANRELALNRLLLAMTPGLA